MSDFNPQFMRVYINTTYDKPTMDHMIMKRHTGDYSVTTDIDEDGTLEVLYEGSRNKCFDYLMDKMKKYWDEQYS